MITTTNLEIENNEQPDANYDFILFHVIQIVKNVYKTFGFYFMAGCASSIYTNYTALDGSRHRF